MLCLWKDFQDKTTAICSYRYNFKMCKLLQQHKPHIMLLSHVEIKVGTKD